MILINFGETKEQDEKIVISHGNKEYYVIAEVTESNKVQLKLQNVESQIETVLTEENENIKRFTEQIIVKQTDFNKAIINELQQQDILEDEPYVMNAPKVEYKHYTLTQKALKQLVEDNKENPLVIAEYQVFIDVSEDWEEDNIDVKDAEVYASNTELAQEAANSEANKGNFDDKICGLKFHVWEINEDDKVQA